MNTIDASPRCVADSFSAGMHAWVSAERAPHVDLVDLAPLHQVDLLERLVRIHPERVVHEDVDVAELRDRCARRARRPGRARRGSSPLFRLARNASLTEEERRKAAARLARVLLPATPTGDPSWSRAVADEYGFVISPKITSEYRDAKLLLQKLEDGNGSIRPGNVRLADKARARLAAIRRSLEPPPHSKYGMYRRHRSDQPVARDQFQQDQKRLFELELKRRSKIGLTDEEVAEEAHRMARVDTLIYGVEAEAKRRLADLERRARVAAWNRQRLQPRAMKDLQLLRVLYGLPPTYAADPEQTPDYPLRDAKPANDGNLYPYNSKLRPPPLWIDEDDIEIADQPKIFYSDPHYWPYTAQRRPPFVPPQPQTDPPPGEDSQNEPLTSL